MIEETYLVVQRTDGSPTSEVVGASLSPWLAKITADERTEAQAVCSICQCRHTTFHVVPVPQLRWPAVAQA